jgi:DNA-binding transcriptional LysR family regulator
MTGLRQLRYFLQVADSGSYRRAAERLAVSHPALSLRIKALEESLGVELFERSSRGVTLTSAGEAFQRGARQVLRDLDLAISSARLADQQESGTLTIAFNELAGQQPLVGRCLALFRASFPKVAVHMSEMGRAEQQNALQRGAIDAGFHYRVPQEGDAPGHHVLERQDFLLVLPEDHPLATAPAVRLEDLNGEPMVCLRRDVNAETYDSIMGGLGPVKPRIVVEASSDAAMLSLVSEGLGVAIMLAARRRGGWQGLVLRPIEGLALSKQFVLAWNPHSRSAPLAKFRALVQRAAQTLAEGQGE